MRFLPGGGSQRKDAEGAQRLGLSRSRFHELYADYLRACARQRETQWTPPRSGGNHARAWPSEVTGLLRKRLSSKPPYFDFLPLAFGP
ncbi:MAG TPA: hypothetical protein PKM73_00975 [Verrucomicrobiota bacterium]|nr:hypothetical protein [Verrucomicrobiota bacterium]HNU53148.1 hypothetical protein [Verrucomicrobiota bacterium]